MKDANTMVWDYVVFVFFIFVTTFVAMYSRFCGKKEKTKADFVFATGKVSMAAMMMSIARGTLGVRSFLGFPSELFYRGSTMWETLYGMVLAYPVVIFIFIPVYFSLGITSVYQYLDMRFHSRLVRCIASATYIIRQLLNLGVTVFTPCVALYTVVGLPYWASIFGITIISVIFTVLGGLKSAIQVDVLQGLTMIAVSMAIIIQGCMDVGGFGTVYNVSRTNGRLDFLNFDMDPTLRVSTFSALVGQLFMSLSIFGCQQNFVQRYCSMDSQKQVTKTLLCNIPVIIVLFSLSWVVGMVIYAVYATCDPYSIGYTSKYDEILPFYMEDKFSFVPGILGLFMASLFNGALSLTVSNLNSLATVTWEDFLSHVPVFRDYKDRQQLNVIKIVGIIYGFIIVGISFGVSMLSGVIEASMLVTSATSGPLLGAFLLAMLVPCCNWKGAATGMLVSHCITLWITFGSLTVDKAPIETLPLSTAGCSNDSFSSHILRPELSWPAPTSPQMVLWDDGLYNTTEMLAAAVTSDVVTRVDSTDVLTQIYSITYMYYSLIGCFITVVLGWIVSYLVGSTESDLYDESLLHPLARKVSRWFPGPPRRYADKTQQTPDANANSKQMNGIATVSQLSERTNSGASIVPSTATNDEPEVYRTKL